MQPDRVTAIEGRLATSGVADTRVRGALLRVSVGAHVRPDVAVGARALIVGADPDADVVLDDPKVSGRHAELVGVPGGVRVRDLGSTNGTFLDGVRVTEALAPPETVIRCGGAVLRVLATTVARVTPSGRTRLGALVGVSAAMREVFAVLELASRADATVLLGGESGTGKELAARAIHDHGARAAGPFITVDCGATHDELLDAQLFGHRAGAFTGAVGERRGAFLEADGGTIFLDEVGELPLPAQAKLLRAIEARTITPLGQDRPVRFDARVVAATHRDLAALVEARAFRFDLFHRLSVVHVAMPPLRARPEDLPVLIRAFYEGRGVDPGPIAGEALERLERHAFPGNVRELRNILERAWVMAGPGGAPFARLDLALGAPTPSLASLGGAPEATLLDTTLPFKEAKERWNDAFERRYLAAVFERNGGNISRAAEEAGIQRRHFRELLVHHGLKEG